MAKILIVDDEASARTVIRHCLQDAGHQVFEASEGEEALRKIKRRRFDLVILDIMMPGLDGYEVLERLRAIPSRAETPVIVVTAKHDPEGVLREAEGGAIDHLAKPFVLSELEAAVERALGSPAHELEGRRRMLSRSAEVYGTLSRLHEKAREPEEPPGKE